MDYRKEKMNQKCDISGLFLKNKSEKKNENDKPKLYIQA